jgi:hypothetical protein
MRKPFSASVALAVMLAADGILAEAMVIVKEPPPPPPRGAGQADSRAPRSGMVWVPATIRGIEAGITGCRAGG